MQNLIVPTNHLSTSLSTQQKNPQFVFVGGKGGVGKTTSSSAIGIAIGNSGHRTLIVSTDPAHSLGDALDYKLNSGQIIPIVTEQNVWALEIDIEKELQTLKEQFENFDDATIAQKTGIPKDLIESIGISDLASIISNPPPGIDEIIALSKIFEYAKLGSSGNRNGEFDRIVIDTAPTGHTLRLLQLPEFLNNFTAKLLQLKNKLSGMLSLFSSFMGGGGTGSGSIDQLFSLLDKLGTLQTNMIRLTEILRDNERTQFIVVTIPTKLAYEESQRLVKSLQREKIKVSSIICNQILDENADMKYFNVKLRAQSSALSDLKSFIAEKKYHIDITEVAYSSTEVTGVYGMKFFYSLAHNGLPSSSSDPNNSKKLSIFGGKGGVGKTTSAASWAMRLCDSGLRTLVVSSDPAHSLGDALQTTLNGTPQLVHSDIGQSAGELWAMEIDPILAMSEFKQMLIGNSSSESQESSLTDDIAGLLLDINDPPPGTDEIVAMSKIISFLDKGYLLSNGQMIRFDRIVLDTAPTGHTLRMLQLPLFLQKTMEKARSVRDKLQGITSMFGAFAGNSNKSNKDFLSEESPQEDRLKSFQTKMQRLESILHDPSQTEFVVVTIPTEVAMAETKRLLDTLHADEVPVRRLIVNQLLPMEQLQAADTTTAENFANAYANDVRKGQQNILHKLDAFSVQENIPLVKIPFCAYEARTVYVLRYIANFIFPTQSA